MLMYISIFVFTMICFGKISVISAEVTKKEVTITGRVMYYIKENGNNESKNKKVILNNYPIYINYIDKKGEKKSVSMNTYNDGTFSKTLIDDNSIEKVWISISSENEACRVSKKKKSSTYTYVSKKVSIVPKDKKSIFKCQY